MGDVTQILLFDGEIFGVPLVFIIIIILVLNSAHEEGEKAKKEAAELWKGIAPGISKETVTAQLGRPQEIVPGTPETWIYTLKDLRGSVMFDSGVVVGYETPR